MKEALDRALKAELEVEALKREVGKLEGGEKERLEKCKSMKEIQIRYK